MKSNSSIEMLIIEADPGHAEQAVMAIKKRNIACSIHIAKDGVEALDFIYKQGEEHKLALVHSLRLILLSLDLPKVDGFEVLNTIKSDEITKSIPVVIFTSSNEESDILKANAYRANSYIVKPPNAMEYSACLEMLAYYWLVINQQLS
jgi:two-component system response regulator